MLDLGPTSKRMCKNAAIDNGMFLVAVLLNWVYFYF